MSLLQQNSNDVDDAALGEDLTKGSSHVLWATLLAAVVVIVVIAFYVISGQKPPAATGEIEQIWVHPLHTETSGTDANGAMMAKETFDQVYVFALVKLHNQSDKPLFVHSIMANTTMADGIHTSYAASTTDYDRIFLAYPNMPVPHGKGLSPQATIAAGQTAEGTIVSAFRMSKADWDARKALDFTFAIQYQPDLTVTPHVPVTVQ